MHVQLKEKIEKIFHDKLTGTEIEELVAFLRHTFNNSINLDEDSQFFKDLAYEVKGEVKELATLLVDFRRELKSKIHPDLTDLATKYIPQTADQLEGVIETTEMATNKIMDNLECMQQNLGSVNFLLSGLKKGWVPDTLQGDGGEKLDSDALARLMPTLETLEQNTKDNMALITDAFVQLSFQDLTGQRIKRIITLVNQMEERIKRMVISFGIRLSEKEKNPEITQEALQKAVEEKVSLLAGPQRTGSGMDQSEIDDLLADL